MNDNHLYTNTQHDAPQHAITYPAILDGIEAMVRDGLDKAETTNDAVTEYDQCQHIHVIVDVLPTWDFLITLKDQYGTYTTTRKDRAAHMLYEATVLWQQQAASIQF